MSRYARTLLVVAASALGTHPARAQTGLEVGAVPAVNYDADEGFGYGAIAELYDYGDGGVAPYRWTLQPTVFLTTEGRKDFTLFLDAPHLLEGWRVSAFVGSEEHFATPWYGVGNAAPYDEARVTDADPYYYRFGRTRRSVTVEVQRPLGAWHMRGLLGVGAVHGSIVTVPDGVGTTLLEEAQAAASGPPLDGWSNHVRAGLVRDTRDRETGPRSGSWTELIVQRVDEALGSSASYTRVTLTDRRYYSTGPLTVAHRILIQDASEGIPLRDLHQIQTSFKQQEGLGGAKSVRGVLKNRYAGRGLMLWNTELRYRALDFGLFGRTFHVVLSAFADAGRVWADGVVLNGLFSELHRGYGGGLRLAMGENFTVAADAGTSSETGLQLYIGLGYLY